MDLSFAWPYIDLGTNKKSSEYLMHESGTRGLSFYATNFKRWFHLGMNELLPKPEDCQL